MFSLPPGSDLMKVAFISFGFSIHTTGFNERPQTCVSGKQGVVITHPKPIIVQIKPKEDNTTQYPLSPHIQKILKYQDTQ